MAATKTLPISLLFFRIRTKLSFSRNSKQPFQKMFGERKSFFIPSFSFYLGDSRLSAEILNEFYSVTFFFLFAVKSFEVRSSNVFEKIIFPLLLYFWNIFVNFRLFDGNLYFSLLFSYTVNCARLPIYTITFHTDNIPYSRGRLNCFNRTFVAYP